MSMSEQQYANWGVAEFMADPAFQDWVSGAGNAAELAAHWKKVQQHYPELHSVMDEAAGLLRELRPKRILQDAEGEQLVWKAIQQEIEAEQQKPITCCRKAHPLARSSSCSIADVGSGSTGDLAAPCEPCWQSAGIGIDRRSRRLPVDQSAGFFQSDARRQFQYTV